MCVVIIHHKDPLRLRIERNGALEMLQKVFCLMSRSERSGNDLASAHFKAACQADRSVTLVLELTELNLAGTCGLRRSDSLKSLKARHLVDTDRANAMLFPVDNRTKINITYRLNLTSESVGISWLGIQPVLASMRLQVGVLLKNGQLGAAKSIQQSLDAGLPEPVRSASNG